MTSRRTSGGKPEPFSVFLDANVLAQPVTRSIIMMSAAMEGFTVLWSREAETQAFRHLPTRATSLGTIWQRHGFVLYPSAPVATGFAHTAPEDRQILADVGNSGAAFLVTENVRDFHPLDLSQVGASAIHPDVFLWCHLNAATYRIVLTLIAGGQTRPSRSVSELHQRLALKHPRLVSRFSVGLGTTSISPELPSQLFRGPRCMQCTELWGDSSLNQGRCPECRERKPDPTRPARAAIRLRAPVLRSEDDAPTH